MLLLLLLMVQTLRGSLSQKEGFKLEAPASVTVQEGLCIRVPCSFSYPLYFKFYNSQIFAYWFKKGANIYRDKPVVTNDPNQVMQETRRRFHLVGNPMENNCSLSIVDAQKMDSGQYFFRIVGGQTLKFSYLSYMVNVSVEALTEKPDIYIPGTLEPGHLVKVICIAPSVLECGKHPNFFWAGAILSSQEIRRNTLYFSELTFTPRPQDHGSNLTCQVTVPGAGIRLERTVHLSVTYKNDILTFSKGILLGAGIMALLALCLILALVKFLRKKQVGDSDPQASKDVADASQVSKGVPWGQHRGPGLPLSSPATQAPSEEIHYASLNFKKISP